MFANTTFFAVNLGTVQELKQYYQNHYGDIDLSEKVFEQLAWLQNNTVSASESNVRLAGKTGPLNIEIQRAFVRWDCFKLLDRGDHSAYHDFIAKQPGGRELSGAGFSALSGLIRSQSAAAKEAIRASCFITMSDQAKILATSAGVVFSSDSEKFITETITRCPQIYPICKELDPQVQQLLPYAFLKDTHGRHMLYTEGGNNMFFELRDRISKKTITKEQYELWFGRWLINIAGFRGHEEPRGSIYLTQNVAISIIALKCELDKLWQDPEYDILIGYLKIRQDLLGVSNPMLAHLGSLLRLYTSQDAVELQAWFNALPSDTQKSYEKSFADASKFTKITPTYVPAVLDNLLALGCGIAECLSIYMEVKFVVSQAYFQGIDAGVIGDTTPLSFRELSMRENLLLLVSSYRAYGKIDPARIAVTINGDVKISQDAPQLSNSSSAETVIPAKQF